MIASSLPSTLQGGFSLAKKALSTSSVTAPIGSFLKDASQKASVVPLHQIHSLPEEGKNLSLYELDVPGIARLFVAVNRRSGKSPLVGPRQMEVAHITNKSAPVLRIHSSYGGTRLEQAVFDNQGRFDPTQTRMNAILSVVHLAAAESFTKHKYINKLLEDGALNSLIDAEGKVSAHLPAMNDKQGDVPKGYPMPPEYAQLKFLGGRCVIAAASPEVAKSLQNPGSEAYHRYYDEICKKLGIFLNGEPIATEISPEGTILKEKAGITPGAVFLTPDFASHAGVSAKLYQYTPQVLGIPANLGGGAGKSSYTVSGVLGAIQGCIDQKLLSSNNVIPLYRQQVMPDFNLDEKVPISLIGSGGGMGSVLVEHLREKGFRHVQVCDINYDLNNIRYTKDETIIPLFSPIEGHMEQCIPKHWKIIPAQKGQFTFHSLHNHGQKGLIIATTFGDELINTPAEIRQAIPTGSVFLLAHNKSLPAGERGIALAKELHQQGIWLFPGQALTAGGAANSRAEIAHRTHYGITHPDGVAGNILSQTLSPDGDSFTSGKKPAFSKRLGHGIVGTLIREGINRVILLCKTFPPLTPVEAFYQYIKEPYPSKT